MTMASQYPGNPPGLDNRFRARGTNREGVVRAEPFWDITGLRPAQNLCGTILVKLRRDARLSLTPSEFLGLSAVT